MLLAVETCRENMSLPRQYYGRDMYGRRSADHIIGAVVKCVCCGHDTVTPRYARRLNMTAVRAVEDGTAGTQDTVHTLGWDHSSL